MNDYIHNSSLLKVLSSTTVPQDTLFAIICILSANNMDNRASFAARAWENSLAAIRDLRGKKQHFRLGDDPAFEHNKSYPNGHSARVKSRQWPLVLRFHKGAIHTTILLPVLFHTAVAVAVICLQKHTKYQIGMPDAIVPCLSIVIGLMLVFRNTTAYTQFSNGRDQLNIVTTSVRCLSRAFFACVPPYDSGQLTLASDEREKILEANKILIACMISIKNHLHTHWGKELSYDITVDEYEGLLPRNFKSYEYRGLGLTLEFVVYIERFIKQGSERGWFHNAAASGMITQLNNLVRAYGTMEVIRLVPVPVAVLIHSKQTLGLFCTLLPFAVAVEMGWLSVLLVTVVAFTLYGIEGIASKFEDPFSGKKLGIHIDDIIKDAEEEVETLIVVWKKGGAIFEPRPFANILRSRLVSDDSWNTAYDTIFGSRRNTHTNTVVSTPVISNNHTRTNTVSSRLLVKPESNPRTKLESNTANKPGNTLGSKPGSPSGLRRFSQESTRSINIPIASAEARAKTKDMKELKAAQRAAEKARLAELGEEGTDSLSDLSGMEENAWGTYESNTSPTNARHDVYTSNIRGQREESSRTSLGNAVAATAASSPTLSIPPEISLSLPSPVERMIAQVDGAEDEHGPAGAKGKRVASSGRNDAPTVASVSSISSDNEIASSVSTGEPPAGVNIPGHYQNAASATTPHALCKAKPGGVVTKPSGSWTLADKTPDEEEEL